MVQFKQRFHSGPSTRAQMYMYRNRNTRTRVISGKHVPKESIFFLCFWAAGLPPGDVTSNTIKRKRKWVNASTFLLHFKEAATIK